MATVHPEPTPPWQAAFLTELTESGCVHDACKAAGIDRSTAYKARKHSEAFAQQWDEALAQATEALEDEARARAFDRSDRASARLLMYLLRAHKPEKYGPEVYGPKRYGSKPQVTAPPSSPGGDPGGPVVQFYIPDNGRDGPTEPPART